MYNCRRARFGAPDIAIVGQRGDGTRVHHVATREHLTGGPFAVYPNKGQ